MASHPGVVELHEKDIPGASLSEPLEVHGMPTLRWWLLLPSSRTGGDPMQGDILVLGSGVTTRYTNVSRHSLVLHCGCLPSCISVQKRSIEFVLSRLQRARTLVLRRIGLNSTNGTAATRSEFKTLALTLGLCPQCAENRRKVLRM